MHKLLPKESETFVRIEREREGVLMARVSDDFRKDARRHLLKMCSHHLLLVAVWCAVCLIVARTLPEGQAAIAETIVFFVRAMVVFGGMAIILLVLIPPALAFKLTSENDCELVNITDRVIFKLALLLMCPLTVGILLGIVFSTAIYDPDLSTDDADGTSHIRGKASDVLADYRAGLYECLADAIEKWNETATLINRGLNFMNFERAKLAESDSRFIGDCQTHFADLERLAILAVGLSEEGPLGTIPDESMGNSDMNTRRALDLLRNRMGTISENADRLLETAKKF